MLDRARFIRENTRLLPVPHAPEIRLHLADEAVPLWQKTEEELEREGLPPPFWAFAWAGGQALARHLLDHPDLCAGARVLDLGAGSGLVAIACAKAGAARVTAVDIDAFAAEAMALNAQANGVALDVRCADILGADPPEADLVTVGDLFYERETAARVLAFLEAYLARAVPVLVGDPGRSYLPKVRLQELAVYSVPVSRALEDQEIKRSTVYRLLPEGGVP